MNRGIITRDASDGIWECMKRKSLTHRRRVGNRSTADVDVTMTTKLSTRGLQRDTATRDLASLTVISNNRTT